MRAIWLALPVWLAGQAFAGTTSLSLGADYASGDYGSGETTRTWTIPLSLKHLSGPWLLRASLPFVEVEGSFSRDSATSTASPGRGGGGGRREPSGPGAESGPDTESGIGDATLAAFYNVFDTRRLAVDVGVKAKLATADKTKKLITTGENDYSLQADMFRALSPVSLFGSLGYTLKGDSDEVDYRNPLYGALGMSWRLARRRSLGVAWDYRQKVVAGGSPLSELSLFYERPLGATDKLQLYAVHGLADGSPDFGAGAVLTRAF